MWVERRTGSTRGVDVVVVGTDGESGRAYRIKGGDARLGGRLGRLARVVAYRRPGRSGIGGLGGRRRITRARTGVAATGGSPLSAAGRRGRVSCSTRCPVALPLPPPLPVASSCVRVTAAATMFSPTPSPISRTVTYRKVSERHRLVYARSPRSAVRPAAANRSTSLRTNRRRHVSITFFENPIVSN